MHLHFALAAWVACQPPCPPMAGGGGDPRWPAGQDPLPCSQQDPGPPDQRFHHSSHDRHWACPPDVLSISSCLAQSPLRTPSDTPTHPAVAQAERPCSPLHRLAGGRRSPRLLSQGTSSPVGTAHPHRCPVCSSQAAAGSLPSRKSWNMCGVAPLSFHPVVCWPPPAAAPFRLLEDEPAMTRSPIPRPLSAMAGRDHPAPGVLSQDRSCRSAARTSATSKMGRLSMGTESSYSILCSDTCPAPNSSRYFLSSWRPPPTGRRLSSWRPPCA